MNHLFPPQQVQDELQLPFQTWMRGVILSAAPELIDDFEKLVRDARNYRHMRSVYLWQGEFLFSGVPHQHANEIDWYVNRYIMAITDDPPWTIGPHKYSKESFTYRNRLPAEERQARGFRPNTDGD